jgi:cyclopropane-fatty-acyl-phospholipid synthase
MSKSEKIVREILLLADIKVGGSNPWDIKVLNDDFYNRVLRQGTLGLGESYMDGWWECEALDQFFYRVIRSELKKKVRITPSMAWHYAKGYLFNRQNRSRANEVAEKHYDISNDLYMSFLDKYNQYTCGYFKDTNDLEEAQRKKLDLICKKLQLKSTDRVLDIGCGWGGFAKFAAENYGCHVTGITISDEQYKYAKEFTKGLPVQILKLDYRDLNSEFDKILICGMVEHVGYKNYRKIFEIVHKNLSEEGLFLLHTIGNNWSVTAVEPWINKYIFPNGLLPSIKQLGYSFERLFVVEDWHNFGQYYDTTLMSWFENFHKNWPNHKANHSEKFYRMFKYYLLSCAGAFRARQLQLWQIVMTKKGMEGGYQSVR